MSMESATTLAQLMLSEPEMLEWLGVDGNLQRERLLHPPAELLRESCASAGGAAHAVAST
jgi:hypothetical protein